MCINPIIYEKLKAANNSLFTTAEVLELGFSKTLLCNYVKAGYLDRIR